LKNKKSITVEGEDEEIEKPLVEHVIGLFKAHHHLL
jgi:hypothetical protein